LGGGDKKLAESVFVKIKKTKKPIKKRKRTNISVKDHMESFYLNLSVKTDRYIYAGWLEAMVLHEPMALRGTKKDPFTGYLWNRKEEFIAKHRYGISLKRIAPSLTASSKESKWVWFSGGVSGFSIILGDRPAYISELLTRNMKIFYHETR
jgi:hypothetical protein